MKPKTEETTAQVATAAPVAEDKPYFATRNFSDADTGREFAGGEKLVDVDAGTLGNYRAAGLASTTRPEAPAS